MRKRERENPCGVCGHYHKYEEGEVCGICGHRMPISTEKSGLLGSAFPSEILPEFLYLGSYDNASRAELLKTQGISRVLNTVPACQNLYKNSFTYHCLQEEQTLPFDDAIQFLEQCEKTKLVFSCTACLAKAAIVIAYLMKCKGWRLAQSYQWVKERRPSVEISSGVHQELEAYERSIFGSFESNPVPTFFPQTQTQPFGFGFNPAPPTPPAFNNAASIFERAPINVTPQDFTFGATNNEKKIPDNSSFVFNANGNDTPMDGS